MFVETVVVVVFRVYSFFGHHDAQQNAFVLLEQVTLGSLLESEVLYHVEFDRDVGCLENLDHTVYIDEEIYW